MTYYYDDELYHYDDELYHHGVKGMKWGVRKARRYIGNGISRIRRKTSQFYNKHRRAINTAAGIAGAAALGYGAYRLDKATGGRGAKLVRNAYGKAANSRVGRSIGSAYGKVKNKASGAYSRANAKLGDYFDRKSNQQYKWAQSAHNRQWDYAGKGYNASQKMAGWNERRHKRSVKRYNNLARSAYRRAAGGSRSNLPTIYR